MVLLDMLECCEVAALYRSSPTSSRTHSGHEQDMTTFDAFMEELQTALVRLYDPAFRPAPTLLEKLSGSPHADAMQWSQALIDAVTQLQPPPTAPAETRGHRLFQVLNLRYVQRRTQDETAQLLHITPRHVRREQNDAVAALAQILWQRQTPAEERITDWSTQLQQELTALERHVPEGVADVADVLTRVVDLLSPVLAAGGVTLRLGAVDVHAQASAHPSGLRQLLVRCITEWARHLENGEIEGTVQVDGAVRVMLRGANAALGQLHEDALVQALLHAYSGEIDIAAHKDAVALTLTLPAAPQVRVLVVDDNEDLLHFYRRYLQETRFQVTALTGGTALLETVEALRPDIIVLDVMLPNTDGWELLTALRQHPLGRTVPVIVCSVIQEEELALALGASAYLAKPVRRSALLQALNTALMSA
ncbi:response regulator [bacterium]|nr:response regulator [bacterium]